MHLEEAGWCCWQQCLIFLFHCLYPNHKNWAEVPIFYKLHLHSSSQFKHWLSGRCPKCYHVWNKHSYITEVKLWNRYQKLHWENRNIHIAVTVLNHYMTHFGILAKERLGDYKWEQHEPWFDEECNKIIRLAELQLGQDPRQNSVRYETCILRRNKEGISEKWN